MEHPDFFNNKKKKKDKDEVFKELDIDPDSDHPVHERFVDEKGLREAGEEKKRKKGRKRKKNS